MMRHFLPLPVAMLTFLAGSALSVSYLPTFALAFLIGVIVSLLIAGSAPYQALVLGREWRPAIGKAALSALFWSFPTAPILLIGFFILVSGNITAGPGPALLPQLFGLTLASSYGLAGAALCRWANSPEREGHWLLRGEEGGQ